MTPDKNYPHAYEIITARQKTMIVRLKDRLYTAGECRHCQAQIYWSKTESGKLMPISRDSYGSLVSHFAVCPYANEARKNTVR